MPNCTTKLFFHGSRNENFWNIIKNGLQLNPKAKITGKMLGAGLYFANKAAKSINYTSLRGSYWSGGTSNIGYMAVFAVAIDPNTAYKVKSSSEISTCYGMTWDKLQKIKPGATHVFAEKGGRLLEDEYCIYRED
jgi:poly [ADP-ribose] polymerase